MDFKIEPFDLFHKPQVLELSRMGSGPISISIIIHSTQRVLGRSIS
jgi:hypothetical protein